MIHPVLKAFVRSWRAHPAVQIASLVVLTGAFTVVTMVFSLQKNFQKILLKWGDSTELTVYLSDSVNESARQQIEQQLKDMNRFSSIIYSSKEAAAREFQKQMGTYSAKFLNDPEFGNPLPASFQLKLRDRSALSFESITNLAEQLSKVSGVEDVSYGQEWLKNYGKLTSAVSYAAFALMALLLAGSLFVISNSIRSSIFQRRDEIEVLELVGATRRMIQIPYITEGALLGLLGAIGALGLCYLLNLAQGEFLSSRLEFLAIAQHWAFLSAWEMLIILCLSIGFGAIASYFCVRGLATGWSAKEKADAWSA